MIGVSAYTIAQCEEAMGEDALNVFLQSFSCPKNDEVERFLKEKSPQFNKDVVIDDLPCLE